MRMQYMKQENVESFLLKNAQGKNYALLIFQDLSFIKDFELNCSEKK